VNADQILAIPLDRPSKLFSGDLDKAKAEYRALARKWHPDVNPAASPDVVAHINRLYEAAIALIQNGVWQDDGLLKVKDVKGRVYQVRYRKHRPFELGDVYIGDRIVVYSIRREFNDLVQSAKQMMDGFRFANNEMRAEAIRFLPEFEDALDLEERTLVVLMKEPDFYCLRDVLEKLGGKMDPRHVAWVMSRLHNLLCYFDWAGIAHNDISLDSYFISPQGHIGCLVGGWWYARRQGDRMLALPERTMRYARPAVISKKMADRSVDAELIRAIGRELLGDPAGSRLAGDKSVPAPMANWLRAAGSADAYYEYRDWYDNVLPKAFGRRRFVRMDVPSGIYD
jgi:hypothetical protein